MRIFIGVLASGWFLYLASGHLRAEQEKPIDYFRRLGGASDHIQLLPQVLDPDDFVWRTNLPSGHSSPCVYENRVYVTTHRDKELATVALYKDTGELRWKRAVPTSTLEAYHEAGSPASCTPACDGERLYVFFGSYGLLCYDLEGQLLWSKPMGPFQDEFGANSSPVLLEDKIVLNQDHDVDSFLIALDKRTGETLWRTARPEFTRSYSTPVVWRNGDTSLIVVAGALQVAAYDARDGNKVWWVDGQSRIVNTTPALSGNMLYTASWTHGGDGDARISMPVWADAVKLYDKNADGRIRREELPEGDDVLLRFFRIDVDQDGGLNKTEWGQYARVFERAKNSMTAIRADTEARGDVTGSHVSWTYRRGLPVIASPLVYDGVAYIVKNGGIVTSLDARDGDVLKRGRIPGHGSYYSSPVAGDGKVYFMSEKGLMTVVRAGGDWELLSYHDFRERAMATPVIDNGRVYVRTEKALYSFGSQNVLTAKERQDGWMLLFDGETLDGWMTSGSQPSAVPVDNNSINPHRCGHYMMVYKEKFENFVLKLDFKMPTEREGHCNSGIFFRTDSLTPLPGKDVGYNGIEIAIDSTAGDGFHHTGALYDLVRPTKNAMRPLGEWNHIVVTSDRNRISVELNSEVVTQMDTDEWPEVGKRADGSAHKFERAYKDHPRMGYIGLQDHGSPIWFRNIKLRPIIPDK